MSNEIEHIICLRCNAHINIESENLPEFILCNNCGNVIEFNLNEEIEGLQKIEEDNEEIEENLNQQRKI
jgi:Fe2+ or Zn2+ uptake regulation protein